MTWPEWAVLAFVALIVIGFARRLLPPRERPIDVVMARARAKRLEEWQRKRDGG